jgi:hypothetical protein
MMQSWLAEKIDEKVGLALSLSTLKPLLIGSAFSLPNFVKE